MNPKMLKMMKADEAREKPGDEAKESSSYQKLERKMGVEKHKSKGRKKPSRGR